MKTSPAAAAAHISISEFHSINIQVVAAQPGDETSDSSQDNAIPEAFYQIFSWTVLKSVEQEILLAEHIMSSGKIAGQFSIMLCDVWVCAFSGVTNN